MAALVAAPPNSNFSLSTSSTSFRASQQNGPSYSDNPLTQLPRVDFNFEDLRARMSAFTVKFDAFIEQGRKRVLEERNEFRARLGELSEDRRTTTHRITSLSNTLTSHAHLISREAAEKAEMHASVASLTTAQQTQTATCARLRTAIAATQRQIDAKRAAQAQYAERQEAQAALNGPELSFWEEYLGCRIEGSGREDVVRVVFVFEPGKSGGAGAEREGVVELKVPERGGYEVVFTKPRLDDKSVAVCAERLNESRDLGPFLKGMRTLLGEVLN